MSIPAIPSGYHSLTPYLTVRHAAAAIEFYQKAFSARELLRFASPDGQIGHAEMQIGDSRFMLSDEYPEFGSHSPLSLNGATASFMIYTEDADALFAQAVAAGATVVMPLSDEFYGDRCGKVQDPFGHKWMIATHQEEVSNEELDRRALEKFGMHFHSAK